MFFGTGQSTNSMARIMKANQMREVCASSPGVSKCFEVGGRLWKSRRLLELRFLQPLDPRGVWWHGPPENFEI